MTLGSGQRFIFKLTKSNRVKIDTLSRYLFAFSHISDKTVLDAACGCGFNTYFIAQEAKECWGIDISEESITYAKNNYQKNNINFVSGNLLNIKLPENYFDVIISLHTIEQTENPELVLKNFSQALKDDGIIILSTPNKKIVSPYSDKPMGKFHKFEFYKHELKSIFVDKFNVEWYGQRCTFKPLANRFIRRTIRAIEILSKRKFGFYGAKESHCILPLTFWREPKDFVIILTKKNENK